MSLDAVVKANQFSTRQRTSVLYDFSAVLKARFYVYSVENNGTFKDPNPEEVLFVQVNPSTLSVASDRSLRISKPMPSDNHAASIFPSKDKNYGINDMTIKLKYDLYDDFNVGTMEGMLSQVETDRHLMSTTATSMERLVQLGRMQEKGVLFKWGPTEFFGAINQAEFEYTAFSRFGEPLKAEGSVTLRAFGYGIGTSGEVIDIFNTTANAMKGAMIGKEMIAKASHTVERVLVSAQVGVTQALR